MQPKMWQIVNQLKQKPTILTIFTPLPPNHTLPLSQMYSLQVMVSKNKKVKKHTFSIISVYMCNSHVLLCVVLLNLCASRYVYHVKYRHVQQWTTHKHSATAHKHSVQTLCLCEVAYVRDRPLHYKSRKYFSKLHTNVVQLHTSVECHTDEPHLQKYQHSDATPWQCYTFNLASHWSLNSI
jgi:hypothetical protein